MKMVRGSWFIVDSTAYLQYPIQKFSSYLKKQGFAASNFTWILQSLLLAINTF
jgi:hypothetical protein